MPVRSARRERAMRWSWAAVDSLVWLVAVPISAWLRFDLQRHAIFTPEIMQFAGLAIVSNVLLGAAFGPYAVGHERASFEEVVDLARTVALTAVVLFLAVFVFGWQGAPRSVPFTASAFALIAMLAARLSIRALRTRRNTQVGKESRAIIFGAGEAGRRLTRSLVRDADSGYHPVALLDDDRSKARLRIDGIKVHGTRDDIAKVADRDRADTLIIALPLAQASTIRELTQLGEDAGLKVLTLPTVKDIIDGHPTAGDLRNVDLADLLGRRPIHLDMAAIADQIAGRRILVTGAGGSIGSELCRQIMRFGPEKLYLLDRDESGLQATQMTIDGNGLLDSDTLILANIRDVEAMQAAFDKARPDIVFHAAALKHLPLLESHPLEAWKTNVIGTLNVLTAAAGVGVGTFVNISTDKAADPISVLGYSKRLAERLTADFAQRFPGRYVSVRFGNVLGSRGSVVHAFTAQIERGGPITVTHPDVKRYFMLIPEACQLVLEAAAIGQDGEVMVLDMGEQVKIVEVAHTLIRMSGRKDIEISFTGLRPGEKLIEDLFATAEELHTTSHELVTRVLVPPLHASNVQKMSLASAEETVGWMRVTAGAALAADKADRPERIHLSKAHVVEIEERFVLHALRSGWVTPMGPHVEAFEAEVADRVGVAGAVALSSGTAALHLGLMHVGARPGTVVVLPTMTFAASANAVAYTGASAVFVDSQESDGNIDPSLLLEAVDTLLDEGQTVAAVMTVDLFGRCVDYPALTAQLAQRGVALIEDAAEALGATIGSHAAGSFGRAAAVSFNGNKIMTTSGGGMLLSDDTDLVDRARYLASQARQPVPWYEHTEVGFNYRMSNVLAALGRAQLSRLTEMVQRRHEIRKAYAAGLYDLPGVRILGSEGGRGDESDNAWLTCLILDPTMVATSPAEVIGALERANIEARHLWKPMHVQPVNAGCRTFLRGVSDGLFAQGLTVPSGSGLSNDEVDRVVNTLRDALKAG